MIYRELALPAPLARLALCAWQFIVEPEDPPAFEHNVPPDGATGFVLVRSGDGILHPRLIGPMLAAFRVPVARGCDYAGLRLRPEMAKAVTGTDPQAGATYQPRLDGPLAPLWRDLTALMDGGADWSATTQAFANAPEGDATASAAVDRLLASGGAMPVAQLATLSGLSERQFRRRFHSATGVTPKQYGDVQRARRALILALKDPDWAGVAHDSGFADQPHLVRDIRERFGAAPLRVMGYFGGIKHELLDAAYVRNLQAQAAQAA